VHDELGKFKQLKGVTLFLDRGQATSWYALTSLRVKLDNGDITYLSSDGERTANVEEFSLYLKEAFDKNLLELDATAVEKIEKIEEKNVQTREEDAKDISSFTGIVSPPVSPPEADEWVESIRAILLDAPMHLMKVDFLFGRLSAQNIPVTYERLLEFIRQQNDIFALYLSGDGSLVQLLNG
jgi:hypothetical protein